MRRLYDIHLIYSTISCLYPSLRCLIHAFKHVSSPTRYLYSPLYLRTVFVFVCVLMYQNSVLYISAMDINDSLSRPQHRVPETETLADLVWHSVKYININTNINLIMSKPTIMLWFRERGFISISSNK